jgi:hypothetical protein
MKRGLAVILGVGCLWSTNVQAATFKPTTNKDGRIIISISGEISDGDTDAFKAAIKSANDAGKFVTSIRLNSIGGSLLEGVKLAEAVRFAKMAANVGQGATCASACFLIFAAGETKYANYTARIGVHGASDQSGAETVQSGAATVSMARVAKELGVPPAIIGRMVVTPPSEMVWLSPSDLQSMGTTMVGKPDQLSTPNSNSSVSAGASSAPMQIQPNSKATGNPNITWEGMVANAIEMSMKQNGGTPKTARSCQPKVKVCSTAIVFKLKETDMMLLAREDLSGKTIEREICTFNSFGDVRTCLDWDTNAKHRDMKDSSGAWIKVSDE